MAEADLQRFLHKVQQLNALVTSLDQDPRRRAAFAACADHNQVVQLAQLWGYDIGRRWGDDAVRHEGASPRPSFTGGPVGGVSVDPLLREPSPGQGAESIRELQSGRSWRLELIHSCGSSSPSGFWYDQREHEWLTLLRGSAQLEVADPMQTLDLCTGDGLYLPPGRRHRVVRTDCDPGTLWLAFYWWDD